jgi:16S rRNA (cytosine967-C5)-methyltransferase
MPISPPRAVAFDILLRIERQNSFAAELLHSNRLDELSPSDCGLATELVMGVLRWRSRLDQAVTSASARAVSKLDLEVLVALRMGIYQLRYLDRIPAHAAINDSVELVKRAQKRSAAPFVNAVLRKIAALGRESAPSNASLELSAALLVQEFAHPLWLVERWITEFGIERTQGICRQDQQIPSTTIRIDVPESEQALHAEDIGVAPGALVSGARVVTSGEVTRSREFQAGRVFIQDEGSQLVSALVGAGSRILDCCAAPGGKTTAIAARNPMAEIVAVELHEHRAALLQKRVTSANVKIVHADIVGLPLSGTFDRVLADVPCSGTGTLARNPEIKWRLSPSDLGDLHARQVAILRAALGHLAAGGRAVYSTCSLEREENEAVVEEVLDGNENYQLLDCRSVLEKLRASGELIWSDMDSLLSGPFLRTLPGIQPCDGFFAAIIEKR